MKAKNRSVLMGVLCGFYSLLFMVPAQGAPPIDFCDSTVQCTAKMTTLNNEFQSLDTSPDLSGGPRVYSGECYDLSFSANPEQKNYGLSLLEYRDEKPWFRALFSYFAEPNPFEGLSVEEGRQVLQTGGSTGTELYLTPTYAWAQFKASSADIKYWSRVNPQTQDVLLFSRTVYFDPPMEARTFCRLKPH